MIRKNIRLYAMSQVQELRAPAPVAAAEGGGEVKPGRMVWYAGATVYRYDWMRETAYMLTFSMEPSAVDLSRMSNAPVLADHWRSLDRTVGVVEKAWLENGRGYAEYRLAETPDTEVVRKKIADGIIRQVSMEANVLEMEDVTPKKTPMRAFLATKWQPQAVALVPVGADAGAQLLSAQSERDLWLAEGLFQPEEPQQLAEAGAAGQQQTLLALLMQRRKWSV